MHPHPSQSLSRGMGWKRGLKRRDNKINVSSPHLLHKAPPHQKTIVPLFAKGFQCNRVSIKCSFLIQHTITIILFARMATAGKRRIVGPSKNNHSRAPSDKVTEKTKNTEIFCSPVMGKNTFILRRKLQIDLCQYKMLPNFMFSEKKYLTQHSKIDSEILSYFIFFFSFHAF